VTKASADLRQQVGIAQVVMLPDKFSRNGEIAHLNKSRKTHRSRAYSAKKKPPLAGAVSLLSRQGLISST